MKKMVSVGDIEQKIAEWRAKHEKFTAEKTAAEATYAEAATARDAVLLAARAEDDPAAREALQEHTEALVKSEREVRDLNTILHQIDGKLRGLGAELRAAQRAEAAETMRVMKDECLACSREIEGEFEKLLPALTRRVRLGEDMSMLADKWNFPAAEAHGRMFPLRAFMVDALRPFARLLRGMSTASENHDRGLVEMETEAFETLLRPLEAPGPKAAA